MGWQVAEVAERLGKPLYPWQRHVVDVALELDEDGRFVYDEIVLTVPRQAGKTTLVIALMVWRLTMAARMWGSQTVTFTAQTRQKARQKLERDIAKALREARGSFRECDMARHSPQRPNEWKLSMNNGSEHIRFGVGNYLNIDAPTDQAGHGDTLDLGVIDEAWAQQDDAVEQAMEPAKQTRHCAQHIIISTAGDERSFFLWRKVLAGRAACKSGQHGSVAYFEWSLPDDADVTDESLWHEYHPNVSNPNVLRAMRAKLDKALRDQDDPEAGLNAFRRGYCNQWPKKPDMGKAPASLPIELEVWDDCRDPRSQIDPDQPVVFAASATKDRSWSSIVVAGYRTDGLIHVELVDRRRNVAWLDKVLPELVEDWGAAAVVVDRRNPAASEIAAVEAKLDTKVERTSLEEYAAACGGFVDKVHDRMIHHHGEPEFRSAVEALRKRKVGEVLWAWSRDGDDITTIDAATLAVAKLPALGSSVEEVTEFW